MFKEEGPFWGVSHNPSPESSGAFRRCVSWADRRVRAVRLAFEEALRNGARAGRAGERRSGKGPRRVHMINRCRARYAGQGRMPGGGPASQCPVRTATAYPMSRMSNVPAALLLSGFSNNVPALIVGTNLGGLGTLIASMASLISYRQIARKLPEQKGQYFLLFTLANIGFLAILLVFATAVHP